MGLSSILCVRPFTATKEGQQQNIFYQSLDGRDWLVLYEIPANAYASDISSLQNISVILFLVTMTMMLVIVFLLIIRINTVKWMAILNHVPNISDCLTSFGKLLEPLLKQQTDF